MHTRRFRLFVLVFAIVLFDRSFTAEQASPVSRNIDRLRSRIEAVVPAAPGVVGISIKHLETNASVALNGDEPFPMASTFKLPVLVEVHALAAAGKLRWDDMVEITPSGQRIAAPTRFRSAAR